MDKGFRSVPGFRSLSQAGIRLREGLPDVSGASPGVPAKQVHVPPDDDDQSAGLGRSGSGAWPDAETSRPEAVSVTPREPGTRRPVPSGQRRNSTKAGESTPQGIYLGALPALRFACPCCATVLTVPNPEAYHGEPGPCPQCAAIVLPPQVVSPFAKANKEAAVEGKSRHYSGFLL